MLRAGAATVLPIHGREWQLSFVSTPAFDASVARGEPVLVLLVGFALSGWANAAAVHNIKIKKFAQGSYAGSRAGVEYSFARNPYFVARNGNIKDFQLQKKIETAVKFRLRVTQLKIERAEKKLAINLGFTSLAAGSY